MRIRPLLALLLLAGCGMPDEADQAQADPTAEVSQEIINGRACNADEEPATLGILVDADIVYGRQVEHMRTIICTGTLIAPDVVLLAAHCVDLADTLSESMGARITTRNEHYYVSATNDMTALASGQSIAFPADAVEAKSWIYHPDYGFPAGTTGGTINAHDIALLFLSKTLSTRPEVVVTKEESSQVVSGAGVTIVGYGQTTTDAEPPAGTVGRKECGQSHIQAMGETEMQIGSDRVSTRKCHGDSGGPTFLDVDTTSSIKRRVVGVTSHAYDQYDCLKGGVDTRVDAWRDWLDQTMSDKCSNGARVWCDVKGVIPPSYYDPKPVDPGSGGDASKGCGGCAGVDASTGLALLGALALRRKRQ